MVVVVISRILNSLLSKFLSIHSQNKISKEE
jgi:hypothetical protein